MKLDLGFPRYFGLFLLWAIATFLCIEYFLYGWVGSLSEDIPRLYGSYALRSLFFIFVSAISVGIIHFSAIGKGQPALPRKSRLKKSHSILLAGTLVTNFSILVLLLLNPALFSHLVIEGVLVEPLSAVFFFAGSAIFCWLVSKAIRRPLPNKTVITIGLSCLALIFFVIAMEEMSWFQRALDFETPEAFSSNLQGEFNIHNFATRIFENAFYVGAFICLIAIPFLSLASAIPQKMKGLEVFVGSGTTLCASALLTAYNYHYWNGFSTQLPYFLTLFILISLGLLSRTSRIKQSYFTFAAALVITQVFFIIWGHTMPRLWDATEYKEGFIAFGFFLYALDVKRNLLRHTAL